MSSVMPGSCSTPHSTSTVYFEATCLFLQGGPNEGSGSIGRDEMLALIPEHVDLCI